MGRTGHQGHEEEEGEGTKKRIDLSVSQVAGAGAATLAAATAASYLNVYGTIIGTAVMAVLSTLVSPLLQHWFSRGGEQARSLAGRAVGQGGPQAPHAPGAAVAPAPENVSETALLRQVSGRGTDEADATRTMALPVQDGSDDTRGDTTAHGAEADSADADSPRVRLGPWWKKRGWRSLVVPAVAVFVLVMLVILVFELFTGRSLTSWTRGEDQVTSPTLFGGTTSAPPASELDAPATTEEEPDAPTGQQGEEVPGTEEPSGPGPGTEGDEGTRGGAPDGAPEDSGPTDEPTGPPAEQPQDPGQEEAPEPDTGEQEGEGEAPAPEPAVPPTG